MLCNTMLLHQAYDKVERGTTSFCPQPRRDARDRKEYQYAWKACNSMKGLPQFSGKLPFATHQGQYYCKWASNMTKHSDLASHAGKQLGHAIDHLLKLNTQPGKVFSQVGASLVSLLHVVLQQGLAYVSLTQQTERKNGH